MRRWILTIASGVLLVAGLGAWIRSYFASDLVTIAIPRLNMTSASSLIVGQDNGKLLIDLWTMRTSSDNPQQDPLAGQTRKVFLARTHPTGDVIRGVEPRYFGFGAGRQNTLSHGISDVERYVVVPLWFVVASSAVVFFVGALAIRRRTRANPTACKSCGYDLRAGHNKCPECGGESLVKVGASNSTNTPSAPTVQR